MVPIQYEDKSVLAKSSSCPSGNLCTSVFSLPLLTALHQKHCSGSELLIPQLGNSLRKKVAINPGLISSSSCPLPYSIITCKFVTHLLPTSPDTFQQNFLY